MGSWWKSNYLKIFLTQSSVSALYSVNTAKALTDYTSQLKPFACKAVVRKSLFTFEWQDCTAVVCAVPISVQAQCWAIPNYFHYLNPDITDIRHCEATLWCVRDSLKIRLCGAINAKQMDWPVGRRADETASRSSSFSIFSESADFQQFRDSQK